MSLFPILAGLLGVIADHFNRLLARRSNSTDSFVALKYGIPPTGSEREILEKWLFTLPEIVIFDVERRLFNANILATPPESTIGNHVKNCVLISLALRLTTEEHVMSIIRKSLNKYEEAQ